jgi:hypothetical protein
MSEEEELRDDAPPPEPDDDRLEMGEPPTVEWEENEPSPHQGEQGQEPV